MKLLIVDDEQHVIKAIKFLINTTKLHIKTILEASCVQDAISIITVENPELIITDVVMDDFTGIDLMEYIRNLDLHTKVIVVSGYDQYNYVRSTLQNGGIDYLLKPIDGSQLNAALEKAISLWEEEQQNHLKNQEITDSMFDICKESLLYKLITQPLQERYYSEFIQILPTLEHVNSVVLGYSSLTYWRTEQDHEQLASFLQLRKDIHALLEGMNCGFCFAPPDTDYEFYIFIYKNHMAVQAIMQPLMESCSQHFQIPFVVGLSNLSAFPSEARNMKAQAEYAFLSQVICGPLGLLIPYNGEKPHDTLASFNEEESQMFSALITGNKHVIDSSVHAFVQKAFSEPPYTLKYLAEFTVHYNTFMKQWNKQLKEYYTHTRFTECPPLLSIQLMDDTYQLSLPSLQSRIKQDLLHISEELTSKDANPEQNIIYQIAHYIKLNYTKPYNQMAYAKLFFINKDYMCRKFKSTFHVNMVSYITQLRLNKAKVLLTSSDMKIRDIAQAVGFDDEKYFSRRFSQEIGISPNEYRLQHTSMGR